MNSQPHTLLRSLQTIAAIAGLVLVVVWMEGGFSHKTPPGTVQAAETGPLPGPTLRVSKQTLPEWREWPAQVTARSTAQLSPKVPGRIRDITVKAGEAIQPGQIVARLEASEWQARLEQARANLAVAEAEAARAQAEARRVQQLFAQEAATPRQQETAQAQARAAQAQVAAARAAVAEAQSHSDETLLRAPFAGRVVRRDLEPGDLAVPGQPVVTVQTAQRLRLEADIPESCAVHVQVGQMLHARIGNATHDAHIEEMAPTADPSTHTVHVKAALDGATQPGAFAWLKQPCGEREMLLLPASAVQRSGQLETVHVVIAGQVRLRHVRTGKILDDGRVEILSGLTEGDEVLAGGAP